MIVEVPFLKGLLYLLNMRLFRFYVAECLC